MTVIGQAETRDKHNRVMWKLLCDCGNEVCFEASRFKYGNTSSCGCFRKEQTSKDHKTHGMSKSSTYQCWTAMKKRCHNSNSSDYSLYGKRGIKVCARWHSFENFYSDMGDKPEGMTIDRIDCNGDYSPENCKWATASEQARNKRNTVFVTYQGVTKSLHDFCDELSLNCRTVMTRLKQQKWTVERALSTPTGRFSNVFK